MKGKLLGLTMLLAMSLGNPAWAIDSILLKSGTKISGTIIAQSKDQVIMKVGDGTAVFAKRAIRRIYDGITDLPPIVEVIRQGSLPPWWIPLADLFAADWVNELESVTATRIDNGLLENVPYLSFRANMSFELNIYGDPEDPAAIELGHYGLFPSKSVVSRCREFIVSYLTTLPQIRALYQLDSKGGSQTVDGLTIQVTPPNAPDAYKGWWILVYRDDAIRAAREPNAEAFERQSERYLSKIDDHTGGELSWTKWEVTDALERLVPMEKTRER